MEYSKKLILALLCTFVFAENEETNTTSVIIHTSIQNNHSVGDLMLIEKGVLTGWEYLLTHIPRNQSVEHQTTRKVKSAHADSSSDSYILRWTHETGSQIYLTQSIWSQDGAVTNARCRTSSFAATCDYTIEDNIVTFTVNVH